MGSGQSFSVDQRLELTRVLTAEFERLKAFENLTDVEISEALKKKFDDCRIHFAQVAKEEIYFESLDAAKTVKRKVSGPVRKINEEELITRYQNKSKMMASESAPVLSGNGVKVRTNSINKGIIPAKSKNVRRRSYAKLDVPPVVTEPGAVAETDSEKKPEGDSWDSVAEQPFCKICQMAFTSASSLERHVNFSIIHEKVMNKLLYGDERGPIKIEDIIEEPVPVQVEGIDYKLLYSGRKLFWRTQSHADLDIFVHTAPNVLEISCLDSDRSTELNRVYIDHAKVETIYREILARREEAKVSEEDFRLGLMSFILGRLQIESQGDDDSSKRVVFILNPSDPSTIDPILTAIPKGSYPIQRSDVQRKASYEVIGKVIESIAGDNAAVEKHVAEAKKSSLQASEALSVAVNIDIAAAQALEDQQSNIVRYTPEMATTQKVDFSYDKVSSPSTVEKHKVEEPRNFKLK